MKYIDEFRNHHIAQKLVEKISEIADGLKQITLMEVCGTHTMAIFRYGLKSLLPPNIKLLSGPGCPVCVTEDSYIDKAIAFARRDEVIVSTFGDMMKVPGSSSTLEKEAARGCDIKVVYSVSEALKIARDYPERKIVFLGVGFETTIPAVAVSILEAEREGLKNYFVFCGHKLIPPAIRALINTDELNVDSFICPGHVSTIIGSKPYQFISDTYRLPCVIAGFEPLDILQAIYMAVGQIKRGNATVEIQYKRSVREEGNPKAVGMMKEVFEAREVRWRGLGDIPDSGLGIRPKYSDFDAELHIDATVMKDCIAREIEEQKNKAKEKCLCGAILQGVKTPPECDLFGSLCTPKNPVGPCMVSTEGTCAAWFKYS